MFVLVRKEFPFITFKFEFGMLPKSFFLPGQPTRFPRSTPFKIKHTKLEVTLDFEKKSMLGRASHTIEAVGSPIHRVTLDAAELSFRTVKVNGDTVKYSVNARSVEIELGFDLRLGEAATLELEYTATPRRGLYFRGDPGSSDEIHAFTQGQSEDSKFWFPCFDSPNMRASSELLVTVPQNMVVVSNGKLIGNDGPGAGGMKTWHFKEDTPHSSYLTSLVAGDFEKEEENHDGLPLQYFLPKDKLPLAKRSFGKTPRMIDFFEKVTGQKYPYEKYAQTVVTDFMFGGMENISATTLTDRTLHDERAHLDFSSDSLVAHELAHQWFGDLLTCRDWSNAWLNEGFATYFDSLFKEHDLGVEEFQYWMMYSTAMLTYIAETERYERPIVTKRYWDADELFDYHTYLKGNWALNCLRGTLGDEIFFKGIKLYVSKHKRALVETSDFRKAMEEASGLELELFFEQWLYSPGYPSYSVGYSWNEESKMVELLVEQTNAENEGIPLFSNPIEIRLILDEDKSISKKIKMETKKQAFYFSLDSKPKNVNFDPKNWILKNLKFQKPIDMHIYQLTHDENSMERVRACQELSSFTTGDSLNALSDAIENDKFWGVRLEAAKALGKVGTKKAMEILLSKASHKDHKARRGIAAGLRHFSSIEGSETAVESLIAYLQNDVSYYARAYAAISLGYYKKSDRAFEALKRNLSQDSFNDIVRFGIFQGFAEMGDQRAVPLAIDYLLHGKHFYGRMYAAYALGKLGRNDAKAIDSLLSMKSDPDTYVKEAAAEGLGMLNDSSLIPSLESWLEAEMEGRVRRMLRESIYNLKQRASESERLSKLDTDVEKLSAQSRKAEERIASLEAVGRS